MSDLLNIQGSEIPPVDDALRQLLDAGRSRRVNVLPGASNELFKDRKPFAVTEVRITFDSEDNLEKCVRLLRWSDERLIMMGSTILWAWNKTFREGMNIHFAVNWYDESFFHEKQDALNNSNHLSYFRMFGASLSDMEIETHIIDL